VIALLAALSFEVSGLLARMSGAQLLQGSPFPLWQGRLAGRDLLLAQTGMGRAAGEAALHLAEGYLIAAFVAFGFCSGLVPTLRGGDLVLARCVRDDGSGYYPDAALLAQAGESLSGAGIGYRLGDILAAQEPLARAGEKAEAGLRSGAIAADMESLWVGRVATQRGLPFLALRAVSDTHGQSLPRFAQRSIDETGNPRPWPMLRSLALHPWELVALPTLALSFRRARRNLLRGLLTILEGPPPAKLLS